MKSIFNQPIRDIVNIENLLIAYKQVRANKGAEGVDGMKYYEMPSCPSKFWVDLGEQILNRTYQPQPARRIDIPKPDGTTRGLNVPCVIDRVVQASIANYITFMLDEDMSDSSYGFRPERCCEQAIIKCLEYVNVGYDWVVDIDLSKFFDTVDQDRLCRLVDNLFHDPILTSLIRKFLTAGVMVDGKFVKTKTGIPQGGPLSPVLANLYLNQADQEFDRRGLHYTRYADDMMILVKSEKAANRVMKSVTRLLEDKLKLKVNVTKSKVCRPEELKYLGFGFERKFDGEWQAIPHEKSIGKLEDKLNELLKRNWSIALDQRITKLNQTIRGWCNYFKCTFIPRRYLQKLGAKIRNRLRAIIWKQWKTIPKREWGLKKLGCPAKLAHSFACARQGYTRCAQTFLHRFIKNEHFKRKGLVFIEEYFAEAHIRFHCVLKRTAGCRTARPVV